MSSDEKVLAQLRTSTACANVEQQNKRMHEAKSGSKHKKFKLVKTITFRLYVLSTTEDLREKKIRSREMMLVTKTGQKNLISDSDARIDC